MKQHTIIDPRQVEASKPGYENLYEQLEFGRFNSVKSGAAPTLYQEVVATKDQREFAMPQGTFTMGDHSLQVFVNGQLMRIGADNDYIELSSNSIEFTFGLFADDVVVFRVNGGTSGPNLHEDHIAQNGQTVFNLAGSYAVGNHGLIVFVNGAYQTLDVDYIEDSAKTVVFTTPLEADDLVTFRVEGLPALANKYMNTGITRAYDNDGRIIREETVGDTHIINEYEYDADGLPSRMITREAGFVITKIYTWENGRNTDIQTTVKEGT